MKFPLSWLKMVSFAENFRLHGPNDVGKLDTAAKELRANNLQIVDNRMNHDIQCEKRGEEPTKRSRIGQIDPLLQFFQFGTGGYINTT